MISEDLPLSDEQPWLTTNLFNAYKQNKNWAAWLWKNLLSFRRYLPPPLRESTLWKSPQSIRLVLRGDSEAIVNWLGMNTDVTTFNIGDPLNVDDPFRESFINIYKVKSLVTDGKGLHIW